MTADDIVGKARECLDTKFRHQGRLKGVGLDCVGMVIYVATSLGVEHVDVPAYGRTPARGLLEATLDIQPFLERVADLSDMQAGDVLMMTFDGDPQHLAIYTGENVVHGYSAVGKVVEHRLDAVWRGRVVRAYRFRGLE